MAIVDTLRGLRFSRFVSIFFFLFRRSATRRSVRIGFQRVERFPTVSFSKNSTIRPEDLIAIVSSLFDIDACQIDEMYITKMNKKELVSSIDSISLRMPMWKIIDFSYINFLCSRCTTKRNRLIARRIDRLTRK